MVRAIECWQSLPALRREPRDVGVSDVAKHFRTSRRFNGRDWRVSDVTLNVTLRVSCDGRAVCTFRRAEPSNWIAAVRNACRSTHRLQCVNGSSRLGRGSGRQGRSYASKSNLYHAWLSLPVCFEPSIHFTRPIVTMSEQFGMYGAACLVAAQS